MAEKLRWGIIATGSIAKAFRARVAHSKTGRVVAVASRSQEKAAAFASEHGIAAAHGSYEALLGDPQVDAVYIATPHPANALWTIRAAEARKHILVEKPIGMNHAEAMAMIEAARENDVFLMEAFMYRCHPQTTKLVELIRKGAIGNVRVIQATFSFHHPKPWNAESRLTSNELGGGGILDVGGYPASAARLIAGAADTHEHASAFLDPIEVKAVGHIGRTGVDEWSSAVLRFPDDIIAHISCGIQVQQENVIRIYGTDGQILVPEPWIPSREGGTTRILLTRSGEKQPQEILVESSEWLYGIEADVVARHIGSRQAPQMSWDDTLGNAKTLEAWRAHVGVVYNQEKPERFSRTTISGRPLAPSRKGTIPTGHIPNLSKPVSRLFLGVDNQRTFPHAAVMFDDFVERGGNAFDTAWIYGGGIYEKHLGAWIKLRNVRDQIVVTVKGAHTPFCTPQHLSEQLLMSLERLQTDHTDIYMLHRDNLDVPIGEFVDVLNEHVRAGRIKTFGGSNWSLERVDAANAYAKQHNLQGFSVVSNNFSLARMVEAPWKGCISASDPESREWFTRTQTPLLAWSSQARGFFLEDRAGPEKLDDKELVRCWYAGDNFQRLQRAAELATRKKVLPLNIALAYVLAQPFPTFALIGPRTLEETRSSLRALDVQLAPDEVRWLNLEA